MKVVKVIAIIIANDGKENFLEWEECLIMGREVIACLIVVIVIDAFIFCVTLGSFW